MAAMNVSLSEKLTKFVQEKVASGLYSSSSEVVREALRLLQEREQLKAAKLEHLRKEIAAGMADVGAEEVIEYDAASIKARSRAALLKQQKKKGENEDIDHEGGR